MELRAISFNFLVDAGVRIRVVNEFHLRFQLFLIMLQVNTLLGYHWRLKSITCCARLDENQYNEPTKANLEVRNNPSAILSKMRRAPFKKVF